MYLKLIDKFNNIQKECGHLAMEMAAELYNGHPDEIQREWLEDVKVKLEELANY